MTDLDAQVRAADPDRWLSSRLISDPVARADVIALYALEAELDAIPKKVSQPLLAEMRFTWWTEHLDLVLADKPRVGHPVLEALHRAHQRRPLDAGHLNALVESRVLALYPPSEDAATDRLEHRYGSAMTLAARMLDAAAEPDAVMGAARIWGLIVEGDTEAANTTRTTANASLRRLPVPAFPAVAHAALRDRAAPEPAKRLSLIWASVRGRI